MPASVHFSSRPYGTDQYDEAIACGRAEIIGNGLVGTDIDGPILKFIDRFPDRPACDGLVLGPAGGNYRCTGTRIEHVKLIRSGARDGGDALKFIAASKELRPGQVTLQNLLLMSEGDLRNGTFGRWARGLVVDGSALPTRGAAGVRDFFAANIRVASCATAKFVDLHTLVHGRFFGLQVDPGLYGPLLPEMNLTNCEHVYFHAAEINGRVNIVDSVDVQLDGFFHTVCVGARSRQVSIRGVVRNLIVEAGAQGVCHALTEKITGTSPFLFKVA
jgi:hypothetical protein